MSVFLRAYWENLIMANYAVPPELLEPYLPTGVELDLFDNKAWVSLVGFYFRNTRLFRIPIPGLGSFEEINLRFYVKRKEGDEWRRGVVFINETVPYKLVAWVANWLYKEHYTAVKTKHVFQFEKDEQAIVYNWLKNKKWNTIEVTCANTSVPMRTGSKEEFIFEHYFGYTRINKKLTEEYAVKHPRWETFPVLLYKIDCDFAAMYGNEFGFLGSAKPDSVFMAAGSAVEVGWKRRKIRLG
jgi:uncharacterized protein